MKRAILLALTLVTMAAVALLRAHAHEGSPTPTVSAEQKPGTPAPLILQEEDGEHLVHRAGPLNGVPFTIKLDGQVGATEDFFVFTETLAPGQTIPFHMHHNAEELISFEEAGAVVIVGDKRATAGAHSLIFIPRDTWISATNATGKDLHTLAVFSRHGFESYMRAISVKPGEPTKPLSQEELTRLRTEGHAMYWDTSKGAYPPGVAHP